MEINKDLLIGDTNLSLKPVEINKNDISNLKPFTLYENSTGTYASSFTVQSTAGYQYIEIYYGNGNYYRQCTRCKNEEVYIPLMCFYHAGWGVQIQMCQFIIRNHTNAQHNNDTFINLSYSDGSVTGGQGGDKIRIFKIVGWK